MFNECQWPSIPDTEKPIKTKGNPKGAPFLLYLDPFAGREYRGTRRIQLEQAHKLHKSEGVTCAHPAAAIIGMYEFVYGEEQTCLEVFDLGNISLSAFHLQRIKYMSSFLIQRRRKLLKVRGESSTQRPHCILEGFLGLALGLLGAPASIPALVDHRRKDVHPIEV